MEKRNADGSKRCLTPLDAWALSFGCIVGGSAFVMPGTTFLPQAGPLGTLAAMIISAGMMMLIGYNYAYMMEHTRDESGPYAYTKRAFGSGHAFLCSWFLCLSYVALVPLNATALTVIGENLFKGVFQSGAHYQVAGYDVYLGALLLAEVVLVVFGVLCMSERSRLRKVQTALALVLLACVAIVTAAAAFRGALGRAAPLFGMTEESSSRGILTVVLYAPWAFVGFDTLCFAAREFDFPVKRSFRLISTSILCGGVVYAALSWLAASAVPKGYGNWQTYFRALRAGMGTDSLPVFISARVLLGDLGAALMGFGAFAAILTGIIGFYRASGHILSGMAEDGILVRRFSRFPASVVFVMCVSMIAPFFGRTALGWIMDMATIGAVIGFGYTSAAAYRIAKEEGSEDIRTTGAAGVVLSGALALALLIPSIAPAGALSTQSFLLLGGWSALGAVFYRLPRRREALEAESGRYAVPVGAVLGTTAVVSLGIWFLRSRL